MAQKQQSSITEGLFGFSIPTIPEFGQQLPIQKFRGSTPLANITESYRQAGESLQGSIRSLFGQQTPQEATVQKANQQEKNIRDAIITFQGTNPEINIQTPDGLRKLANFAVTTNPDLRMFSIQLNKQADAVEQKQIVATREAKIDELNIKKLEAEIKEKFKIKLPTTKGGLISLVADITSKTNNLKNATPYQKNLVKVIKEMIIMSTPGKDNVVNQKYEIKMAEEIAKLETDKIPKLETIIQNIDKAIAIIDKEDSIVSGGLLPDIRFMGAEAISDFSVFTKLGIVNKDKIIKTAEYLSLVGEGVLDAMGALGGSDSNEELRKMEKLRGAFLGYPQEALKQILLNIKEKELKVINNFKRRKKELGLGGDDINLNEKIKIPKNKEDLIHQELRKRGLIK